MAAIEELLYSHLSGDATLSSLVGDRIYPDLMPQNVTLPAIRYLLVDRNELLAKPNVATFRLMTARIQVDVFTTSYASAKTIQAALTSALYGFNSSVSDSVVGTRVIDVSDAGDANEREVRVTVDALVTYNE